MSITENRIKSDVQIEDLPDGAWREFAKQHGIDPILGLVEKQMERIYRN
tara:strand:- start:1163 stop:1309 length:147 start_codon:yes stop_codon:yes gene_type:complete